MTEATHTYPSRLPPGSHWATDEAWEILDRLPHGMLPDDHRFFLAGMIAGTLMRKRETAAAMPEDLRRAVEGAYHALRSYACGNAEPSLATKVASHLQQQLARLGIEVKP